jgi:hypothetical protein
MRYRQSFGRTTFDRGVCPHNHKCALPKFVFFSQHHQNTKKEARQAVGLRLAAEIQSINKVGQAKAGDRYLHKRMNCCSFSILCSLYYSPCNAAGHASHASGGGPPMHSVLHGPVSQSRIQPTRTARPSASPCINTCNQAVGEQHRSRN